MWWAPFLNMYGHHVGGNSPHVYCRRQRVNEYRSARVTLKDLIELCRDLADLLAFSAFPPPHWRRIWSTSGLERVNKEIKRRSNVVGIFPNEASVTRLAGSVLMEIHDEWALAERRYLSLASMEKLYENLDDEPERKELEENKQLRAS